MRHNPDDPRAAGADGVGLFLYGLERGLNRPSTQ
jgi:hypothetical protein